MSCCSIQDGPLVLAGSWLSSLVQLRTLGMQASSIELGSDCGQLAALRDVHVCCGWEAACDDAQLWYYSLCLPAKVSVEPGAIPPGLTSMSFQCCSMPELPSALCAATGLKELELELCAVRLQFNSASVCMAPLLGPALGGLTALEKLQLRRLHLQRQPGVPSLLGSLTRLQHLDLTDCLLGEGGDQALVSACQQLSGLSFLSLGSETSTGSLQAAPGSLPSLRELRLTLPSECQDQQLPLLAAAPGLQSLLVCASTLLCASNLGLLQELADLRALAVV